MRDKSSLSRYAAARLAGVVMLGLVAGGPANAGPLPDKPEDVINHLFSKATAAEARQLTIGELGSMVARSGNSPAEAKIPLTDLRPLAQDSDTAVYSSSLTNQPSGTGYVFLRRDGGQWKVEALRSMVYPPQLLTMLNQWDSATPAARDEQFKGKPAALRTEFEGLVAAVRLSMKKDSETRTFFTDNKAVFERAKDQLVAGGFTGRVTVASLNAGLVQGWRTPPDSAGFAALTKDFRDLFVTGGADASFGGESLNLPRCGKDCVTFTLFGMPGASFGFMWIGPKGEVPKMSPQGFIAVEPVSDGWYMFRIV